MMRTLVATLFLTFLPALSLADGPGSRPSTQHALRVYTAFGGTYSPASVSGTLQRYTFTGRESSGHSAAGAPMFYRNRTYSPGIGRFGRRDPVADGRNNFSSYIPVRNRPTIDVDPSGMFDCPIEEDNRYNDSEIEGTRDFFRSWGFSLTDAEVNNIVQGSRSGNGWTHAFRPVLIGKYTQGSKASTKPSIRSERGDKIVDPNIAYLVQDTMTQQEIGRPPECTWYAWYEKVQYLGGAWVLTNSGDTETLAHERTHAYIYKAYAAAIYGAFERGIRKAVGVAVSPGGASGDKLAKEEAEDKLRLQTERWDIVASSIFEAHAIPAIAFQDTVGGRWISRRPRLWGVLPPFEGWAADARISLFDPTHPTSTEEWYEEFRSHATLDAGALYRDLTEPGSSALSPWMEGVYRYDGMRLLTPPVILVTPEKELHP